ncbi:MAG TPA: transposase [Dehalococcoidia bacterium]|nr:transposase [Dehalococcoidia bacterium]
MMGQGISYKNLPKFNDNSYVHFVTTRTYENHPYFENDEFLNILLEELKFYSKKNGFTLMGYVIMPDHVHLLLWWDKEEKPGLSISKIMQVVKGATSRQIVDLVQTKGLEQTLQATHKESGTQRTCKRELQAIHESGIGSKSHKRNLRHRIWQPGFYDFNVHSEEKLLEKLNYMHNNPVKAGLVSSPQDYKWSSFKEYFEE